MLAQPRELCQCPGRSIDHWEKSFSLSQGIKLQASFISCLRLWGRHQSLFARLISCSPYNSWKQETNWRYRSTLLKQVLKCFPETSFPVSLAGCAFPPQSCFVDGTLEQMLLFDSRCSSKLGTGTSLKLPMMHKFQVSGLLCTLKPTTSYSFVHLLGTTKKVHHQVAEAGAIYHLQKMSRATWAAEGKTWLSSPKISMKISFIPDPSMLTSVPEIAP